MKGTADLALMAAAASTVQTLRDVLTQLSVADAETAFLAVAKARPVLHHAADRLRIALKGRPVRQPRVNKPAETPWGSYRGSSGLKSGQASTASAIHKGENQ